MTAPLPSRWAAWVVALLVLCVGAVAGTAADDQTLDDFKRFFKRLEGRADRIEAVLSLERIEDARVVSLLVPLLADEDPAVVAASVRVLGDLKADAPRAALVEALVKSRHAAQRVGLLDAVARGGHAFGEELAKAAADALEDKQWTVRLAAAKAFGALGGPEGESRLAAAAADREPAVRAGALDALAGRRARAVVEPALVALADPVWQVRASAIAALATVRDARAIPALIARFDVEEGRLVADIAAALENLTGRAFGQDIDGWKRFWNTFGDRFQMPTDEEIAKQAATQAAQREKYSPSGATVYHGIDTPSRAIVFVIDVSGSMETHVVEKHRFKDGGYPSFARIDIVKTELARTVELLEPHVRFNVLSFATEVRPWRAELVPANGLYKKSAIDWIGKLEPLGTAEDAVLASAGFAGSSNLHLGKTNTYGAIMAALGLPPGRTANASEGYQVDVDTIFFLSDGHPTHGEYIDPNDILNGVREANALRRVVLHTLALGDFDHSLMKRLAQENGGAFIDLGK